MGATQFLVDDEVVNQIAPHHATDEVRQSEQQPGAFSGSCQLVGRRYLAHYLTLSGQG